MTEIEIQSDDTVPREALDSSCKFGKAAEKHPMRKFRDCEKLESRR